MIVETIALHEIYDVELVRDASSSVADGEEKPLGMFTSEVVRVYYKVIFERPSVVTE